MIARVARSLGCTDGQAWTLVLGALLAVVTVGLGLPPAFRGGDLPQAQAAEPLPPGPRVGPADAVEVPVLVTLGESPRPSIPRPVALPTPTASVTPAAPAAAAPTTTTTTAAAAAAPAASIPLTVRDHGWASSRGGTPIAAAEVPDGTLPIGARAGSTDELSFVRLDGSASTLRLAALDEPLAASAVLRACPIVDPAWQARENLPLEEAPVFDCERSAPGTLGEDGVWTFELGAFADRAGPNGFALVPGDGAGTFRIRLAVAPPA